MFPKAFLVTNYQRNMVRWGKRERRILLAFSLILIAGYITGILTR